MKAILVVALTFLGLGVVCEAVDAQDAIKLPTKSPTERARPGKVDPRDKVKVPDAFLSIGDFYARRDPNAVPPRIRVAGYYHNYTRQTITGATFAIERWNGTGWTSIKSGPLNAIAPNKPGAESVDLPLSDAGMKFRFVVSKSVEGSKQTQLPALLGTRGDPKGKVPAPSPTGPKKPLPIPDTLPRSPTETVKKKYLSIDRVYAVRTATKIVVRAELSNPNVTPISGATAGFESWTEKYGWSAVPNGWAKLPTIAPNGTHSMFVEVPMSNEATKFRLASIFTTPGTKECLLPQRRFVVQYRIPEWQEYWRYLDDTNRAAVAASELRRDFNLEAKIDHFGLVGIVFYRSVKTQERVFMTPAAARDFQVLLENKVGSKGLLVNTVER
jgi:hypothetical protein